MSLTHLSVYAFLFCAFRIPRPTVAGEYKDTVRRTTPESETPARREICGIAYESNVLSAKGPRKMTVVLPKVTQRPARGAQAGGSNSLVNVWRPVRPTETLFANYRATCTDSMLVLQNKAPKWNEQVGAYVLNFGGRVTMASVKNFQLMSPDDPDTVVLQFGRTGTHSTHSSLDSLDSCSLSCPHCLMDILSYFDHNEQ